MWSRKKNYFFYLLGLKIKENSELKKSTIIIENFFNNKLFLNSHL